MGAANGRMQPDRRDRYTLEQTEQRWWDRVVAPPSAGLTLAELRIGTHSRSSFTLEGNLEAARDRKGGGMRRGPFDCRNVSLSRTQPVGICVHKEVTVHHSCVMLLQNPELQ